MKTGLEDRGRPFNPDDPAGGSAVHLILVPVQDRLLTDEQGRVIVIPSKHTLREFFSRTFPDGRPITIGGAVLQPFHVVSLGPAEWAIVRSESPDAFCEFDSAMDIIRCIQSVAAARLDSIRRELEEPI